MQQKTFWMHKDQQEYPVIRGRHSADAAVVGGGLTGLITALWLSRAGLRVALGNSWSTLVAAELLSAKAGLGYMIQQGRSLVRPDIIIVGMLSIGITGALLSACLSRVEKKFVKGRNAR